MCHILPFLLNQKIYNFDYESNFKQNELAIFPMIATDLIFNIYMNKICTNKFDQLLFGLFMGLMFNIAKLFSLLLV